MNRDNIIYKTIRINLATLLEEGKLGEKNIARAYKCYELGSRYGSNCAKTGKRLLERQYEAAELETNEICVKRSEKMSSILKQTQAYRNAEYTYGWGGTGNNKKIDCSHLVSNVLRGAG